MPSFQQAIQLGEMVIKIVGDDSDLQKAFKNAKKLVADTGSSINDVAQQLDRSVAAVFAGLAASITAVGAAAVATGSQFETAMMRVQAVSGATADEMAALTDQAREIGKTTSFSAKDAADAMYVLSQAGLDTKQIMASVSDVMVLAAGSGLDLDSAAGLVASTLTAFNLSAEQSGRVVDVLTMAANKSLLSMQDLKDALKYAGTAGADFGVSLEETVTAVAKFRDLGLSASQSGTAFRNTLVRLADPAAKGKAVLKDLHLSLAQVNPQIVGFQGALQALAKAGINSTQAMDLFGKISGASINALIEKFRRGTDGFGDFEKALNNSAGSAGIIFEKMQSTVSAQFQILKNKIGDILISLFEDAEPALLRLISGLQSRVSVLADYVTANSKNVGSAVDKLVDGILRLTDDLILLLPRVKEIGAALALVFVAAKVYEFTTAVISLANAFGLNLIRAITEVVAEFAALDAATAFLAVTTGAGAVVVGVGLLVAAVGKLVDRLSGAAAEAEKLAIGLKAAGLVKDAEDTQAQHLQHLIDLQKEQNDAQAAAGLQVSEMAQQIAGLTGAQALQEVQAGRMIELNDKLVSTAKAPIAFLKEQAAELQVTAGAYADTAEKAAQFVDQLDKQGMAADATGDTAREFAVMSKQLGVTVNSYDDVVAVQKEYVQRSKDANTQANKLTDAITRQRIASADAAKNAKANKDAIDRLGDGAEDDSKKLEKLRGEVEKITDASDPMQKAMDKLQDDLRTIDKAVSEGAINQDQALAAQIGAWDTYASAVENAQKKIGDLRTAGDELNRQIQVVTDQIDDKTAIAIEALAQQLTDSETKTISWAKTMGKVGDMLDSLGKKTGLNFSGIKDDLKKLGGSADQFFKSLAGGKLTGTGGMLGAVGSGFEAVGAAASGGIALAAEAVLKGGGQQILDFLKQFPAVIGDVIQSFLDLSSVLSLDDIFSTATNDLKDWNKQVADAQTTLSNADNQVSALQYSLSYASGLPLSSFKGKTRKDRRKAKKDYIDSIRGNIGSAEQDAASASSSLSNLNANKPKSPGDAEAQAIVDRINWLNGFIHALPQMLQALRKGLPGLLHTIATDLPKALLQLANMAVPAIKAITDAFATMIQHSDKLIHAFTAIVEAMIDLLVYSVPVLTEAVIGALPQIITALIADFPRLMFELVVLLPVALIAGLIAAIPGMVKQIKNGLKEAFTYLANHWLSIVTFGLSDLFQKNGKNGQKDTSGFLHDFGAWIGSVLHPNRHARGTHYVPRTMTTVLEPGESVLDRAATQALARGTYYPPAPVGGGAAGGGFAAQLLVAFDGQVVDAALYRSMAAGRSPKLQRAIRSGKGTKVGYSPGRGSFFG